MIANIKYIYDESGEVEAAIVPIQKWRYRAANRNEVLKGIYVNLRSCCF
ncbi:MAG: hypothetical protein AAF806_28205 [Bacteroidota bacterium]